EALGGPERDALGRLFEYLPGLRVLWQFAGDARALFAPGQTPPWAWRRRAALLRQQAYQEVPELVQAMGLLCEEKFAKAVAFVYSPAGRPVRTNNHVERANRRLRFAEQVRYKWRRRRGGGRYLGLALDRWGRPAGRGQGGAAAGGAASNDPRGPGGGRKNGPAQRRRAAG